ncbi:DUF6807 family protein [Kiritimatiella glycovorans]|uniref:Uncharacterized protein n=1 Tax=Kiritimatiella glycovorans TaxID=1307763 RepID=A0A0G3EAL0_9BACT|nr:DUF6807 family protein [Kiritimatiella glycovorans]AKJ63501.1 hypothetical protein L21SP4_00217 [Kiritimatiella glycovorans]
MSKKIFFIWMAILAAAIPAQSDPLPVTARMESEAVVVDVDGERFTEYRFVNRFNKKPYLWPLAGPLSGKSVTTESSEPYPHHNSAWFGCDHINGYDFWHHQNQPESRQISRGPEIRKSAGDRVVIEDICDWQPHEGDPVMRDYRRITVSAPDAETRFLDFAVVWVALEDVRIRKTNHSLFALRIHPELSVQQGGTLVNAAGDAGQAQTLKKNSPWMDYHGAREGGIEGAAILTHPENRWHPSPWLTRDYGFFSPTPMLWLEGGEMTLEKGEAVKLAYRVVVHAGDEKEAEIDRLWGEFARSRPLFSSAWMKTALEDLAAEVVAYEMGDSRDPLLEVRGMVDRGSADPDRRALLESYLLDWLGRPETTVAATQFIGRQLGRIGGAESVPALHRILSDDDAVRARAAGRALTLHPSPEAGRAMIDALERVAPPVRRMLIAALADRAEPRAVSALEGYISGSDPETAAAAASALARIDPRAAVRVLGPHWKRHGDDHPAFREALLQALNEVSAAHGEERKYADAAAALFAGSDRPHARIAALNALLRLDPGRGESLLVDALTGEDPDLRRQAVRLLRSPANDTMIASAVKALPDLRPGEQAAALTVLADRHAEAALPAARALLASDDPAVREAAARVAGRAGGTDDIDPLLAMLPSDAAETALARIPGAAVTSRLLDVARSSEPAGRARLIDVLAGRADPSALPAMIGWLASEDRDVRRAAADAVAALGDKDTLQEVLRILMRGQGGDVAADAAARLAKRLMPEGRASDPLLAAWRRADPSARPALIRVLGMLREDASLSALEGALDSDHEAVRDAAVRVLANWRSRAALPVLLKAARQADGLKHNVLALRGYAQILTGLRGELPPAEIEELYAQGYEAARRDEERALLSYENVAPEISDLETKSPAEYKVSRGGLWQGVPLAVDREYIFKSVPPELAGATYILTAMGDKRRTGEAFLKFRVKRPVTVYVGFDRRCTDLPDWLEGWSRPEMSEPLDAGGLPIALYAKRFDPGAVVLGGPAAPGVEAMYTVVLKYADENGAE